MALPRATKSGNVKTLPILSLGNRPLFGLLIHFLVQSDHCDLHQNLKRREGTKVDGRKERRRKEIATIGKDHWQEEIGTLLCCWWRCEMVQLRWKTVKPFLKKLKLYDAMIPPWLYTENN